MFWELEGGRKGRIVEETNVLSLVPFPGKKQKRIFHKSLLSSLIIMK